MFHSKSVELVKVKRIKAKRYNNPGHHISKLLALLIFAGFLAWIILANVPENKKANTPARSFQEMEVKNKLTSKEICSHRICRVSCEGGSIDDVQDFMHPQASEWCGGVLDLTLINITFSGSALKKNWLTGSFTVRKLSIRNSDLNSIEENAFKGSAFQKLSELEICNASIAYLKKGSFAHLTSLTNIKLDYSVNGFSPEYLDGVQNSIKEIEIHGVSDLHAPNELFGSLPLPKLQTLELGNNNFGDTIDENTFQNSTPSSILNLTDCKISSLHPRTFKVNRKGPAYLYLEDNYLKEVSSEVFEPMVNRYLRFTITLSGNPWNCTYALLPLIKLITENSGVYTDEPKCASPPEFEGKQLHPDMFVTAPITSTTDESTSSIINVTETITTTTVIPVQISTTSAESPTLSTTDPSETITTPTSIPVSASTKNPDDSSLTEIICKDPVKGICTPGSCDSKSILYVKEMDMKFNISKVSSGAVWISIQQPAKYFSISWFTPATKDFSKVQNHTEHNLGCVELEMQNFTIQGLELGALYIFCIIQGNDTEMTPLNCQSHLFEVDCNEAESKTALILSAVSILVAVFLGAVTMFCLIRYNPALLKGTKRIVILGKNPAEVPILPNGKRRSDQAPGMNSIKRDISGRRLSAGSRESTQDYIMPYYEVISNRSPNTQRKDSLYFERLPARSPPPLPERLSTESVPELAMQSDKLECAVKLKDSYYDLDSQA